jgi:type II secretory pathway pseudopilin PulG
MHRNFEISDPDASRARSDQVGYTFLEILAVTAIILILVLATQGMMRNHKRFAIEETCVQRLQEISRAEHVYRFSNDPTVNPESTYGTFFELQNANLIPDMYKQSDEKMHTVCAFVPHYRLDFVRSVADDEDEPDAYRYLVLATPLRNTLGLKTFYMQEDGEVYWQYFLHLQPM